MASSNIIRKKINFNYAVNFFRLYKCYYDAGQNQYAVLYVSRAELDKIPSKTVNHNWAEWFQRAHKDLLGSDIETQPAPHQLIYVDRATKQGLKATFIMNAKERILKDYDFMHAWPTFQGNVMFVMKMKLEEIVYQSEVL